MRCTFDDYAVEIVQAISEIPADIRRLFVFDISFDSNIHVELISIVPDVADKINCHGYGQDSREHFHWTLLRGNDYQERNSSALKTVIDAIHFVRDYKCNSVDAVWDRYLRFMNEHKAASTETWSKYFKGEIA